MSTSRSWRRCILTLRCTSTTSPISTRTRRKYRLRCATKPPVAAVFCALLPRAPLYCTHAFPSLNTAIVTLAIVQRMQSKRVVGRADTNPAQEGEGAYGGAEGANGDAKTAVGDLEMSKTVAKAAKFFSGKGPRQKADEVMAAALANSAGAVERAVKSGEQSKPSSPRGTAVRRVGSSAEPSTAPSAAQNPTRVPADAPTQRAVTGGWNQSGKAPARSAGDV
jgi:hypothetical protein